MYIYFLKRCSNNIHEVKLKYMYTGFKHLHSWLAYLLLAALLLSILVVLVAAMRKNPYTDKLRKVALIGLISAHLQLVIGLVLYFISPVGFPKLGADVMKDSLGRLYALEHPLTMIIAIVLITIGYSRAKKMTDDGKKYNSILIFYVLGLLLILLRIPWHAWPN